MAKRKYWTTKENDLVRNPPKNKTLKQLAQDLGRSEIAVRIQRSRLFSGKRGSDPEKQRAKSERRRVQWTPDEDRLVRKSGGKDLQRLATQLNRSYGAVRMRRSNLKKRGRDAK